MQLFFLDNQLWTNTMQAFCWMLVHSIWQGLMVTVFGGITIYLTQKHSAALRYNIITTLFFAFLLACLVTFIYECGSISQTPGVYNAALTGNSASFQLMCIYYTLQRLLISLSDYCSSHAQTIVLTWFVFFLFKLGLMIRGFLRVRLITNSGTNNPASHWEQKIKSLCSNLRISKQVSLLESAIVKMPVVVGYLKPMILIPIGLLNNLPAEQVEAVLLHELAHIRRNDYFINFIQNIAETVFFFNPALLWLSGIMRVERENCCDDIALDHTKNKKQFLEALISFKEYAVVANSYVIAFPGRKNHLLHRFTRIITNRNKSLAVSEKIFLLLSLFCCCVFFVVVSGKTSTVKNSRKILIYQQAAVKSITRIVNSQVAPPANKTNIADLKSTANIEKKKIRHSSKSERDITFFKPDQAAKMERDLVFNNINMHETIEHYNYELNSDIKIAEESKYLSILKQQEAEKDKQQSDIDRDKAANDKMQAEKTMQQAFLDKIQAGKDQQRAFVNAQNALLMKLKAEKDMQAVKSNHTTSQHIE